MLTKAMICSCMLVLSYPCNGVTIDILGAKYSNKLAALLHRVERKTKTHVVFIPKVGAGDNSIALVGGEYHMTLAPGSTEDDVAHELMHALLESEGYTSVFMIATIPLSVAMHPIIASDFDHLIINRRLHREGYRPETGFMAKMRDQYKSFVDMKVAVITPEQRAVFGVGVIHELMKQVYYVRSSKAEQAILRAYPSYRTHWLTVRNAIIRFRNVPTVSEEWNLVKVYVHEMDRIFSEAGMTEQFSDLIAFDPLPVNRNDLNKPASRLLSASSDPASKLLRIKAGGIMVSVGYGDRPDLSQPLERAAQLVGLRLWPLKPLVH
jgi:hypothetical protein